MLTCSNRLLLSIRAWCSWALARRHAMLLLRKASASSYMGPGFGDARPLADDEAVVELAGELWAWNDKV